jgi:hypothetical protein
VLFGALVALVLAADVGPFGFTQSTSAPLFDQAIAVESATILAGTRLAGHALRHRRRPRPVRLCVGVFWGFGLRGKRVHLAATRVLTDRLS